MTLLNQTEKQILERKLVRENESLLFAVSGGLDSMVLWHLLRQLAPKHGWKISVVHFNHQLRGRASEADEKFVREVCLKNGIPFIAGRGDVKGFARISTIQENGKRTRPSIEMAARTLRHEFFARTAVESGVSTIALAHHADDQIELFFLRLLRGGGTESLGGMKWISPSPKNEKVQLIRPLLNQTRAEIERYAKENKIRYREDTSNASLDFQRNQIRHRLLPLLEKEFQPALRQIVPRVMEMIGAEAALVEKIATSGSFDGKGIPFGALPPAIQRRLLYAQLQALGLTPEFDLIETLRRKADEPVAVGTDFTLHRDTAGKLHRGESRKFQFLEDQCVIDVSRGGSVQFAGRKFSWKLQSIKGENFSSQSRREFFDARKLPGEVILRHWRKGDRFQPIGMKEPVKLQDLFTNLKVPREERLHRVVAEAATGPDRHEIFWVEGLRIAENFKLTPSCPKRLCWSWEPS